VLGNTVSSASSICRRAPGRFGSELDLRPAGGSDLQRRLDRAGAARLRARGYQLLSDCRGRSPEIGADPRLRNPAAGDYRLGPTSPAIDFCDTTHWASAAFDIEWQSRDLDHPFPDRLGIRDLGADEYQVVVFRDGFESGDAAPWSSVSP
jgi:hypothetical protein